jgi:hypothetical protein
VLGVKNKIAKKIPVMGRKSQSKARQGKARQSFSLLVCITSSKQKIVCIVLKRSSNKATQKSTCEIVLLVTSFLVQISIYLNIRQVHTLQYCTQTYPIHRSAEKGEIELN